MSTPPNNPLDDSVIELEPIDPTDASGRSSVAPPVAGPVVTPVFRSIEPTRSMDPIGETAPVPRIEPARRIDPAQRAEPSRPVLPPTPKPVAVAAPQAFIGKAMPLDDVEPDDPSPAHAPAAAGVSNVTTERAMESVSETVIAPEAADITPALNSAPERSAASASAPSPAPTKPSTPAPTPVASKPPVIRAASAPSRAKDAPLSFNELLAIFALEEVGQEKYFPHWTKSVRVKAGNVDTKTRHARFAALAMLADYAKQTQTSTDGDTAQVASEIAALATMLVESSTIWEFLVWHPRDIYEDETAVFQVDPTLYEIWSVMRRLCRAAIEQSGQESPPRPFDEAFAGLFSN